MMKKILKKVSENEWPVKCSPAYLNCQKIHPLQQQKIADLISHVIDKPYVRKIIIFGSSVNSRCHIESDVDIYAVLSEDKKVITKYLPFVYDLWTNYTISEEMLKEIKQKGVTVYERESIGQSGTKL